MKEDLLLRIARQPKPPFQASSHPPAAEELVVEAENELGFRLPLVLRLLYVDIGNGGIGPGYGVVGLRNGAPSDYGTLLELYNTFRESFRSESKTWPRTLLPFCEWGSNIYSCVDCTDERIFLLEDFSIFPCNISIDEFFELWASGQNLLDNCRKGKTITREVTNPETGQKITFSRRKP